MSHRTAQPPRNRDGGPTARPTFRERAPLALREVPAPPDAEAAFLGVRGGLRNDYVRFYTLGECKILVTKEGGRWHLSISHPRRYPTWDEIAEARYRILPREIHAAIPLPPESEYLNLARNCFHVYEIPALDAIGGPP